MNQEKQRIVVATHNKGKVAEIERILSSVLGDQAQRFEFVTSGELGLPDPVEDGVTFSRNALLKARDAAARSGLPAMADDSGLIVDVMGKAPESSPPAGRANMGMTPPTTLSFWSSWPISPTSIGEPASVALAPWSFPLKLGVPILRSWSKRGGWSVGSFANLGVNKVLAMIPCSCRMIKAL